MYYTNTQIRAFSGFLCFLEYVSNMTSHSCLVHICTVLCIIDADCGFRLGSPFMSLGYTHYSSTAQVTVRNFKARARLLVSIANPHHVLRAPSSWKFFSCAVVLLACYESLIFHLSSFSQVRSGKGLIIGHAECLIALTMWTSLFYCVSVSLSEGYRKLTYCTYTVQ